MTWPILWMVVGLVGLMYGADLAVEAGRRLALRLNVSTLAVGLTLTSIGTSLPEIATNVAVGFNAMSGHTDASALAFGNILGSCLSQITLLLGLAAIASPLAVPRKMIERDGLAVIGATALMWAFCWNGVVSRMEGLIGIAVYAVYLGIVYTSSGHDHEAEPPDTSAVLDTGKVLVGLFLVGFCADLVVDNGVTMARALDVPETLIGLLVGVGTGLPELVVAVRAAIAKDAGMSLGNLLGSNVTDPLLSFGAGAVVHPVVVPLGSSVDFIWWIACSVIALLLLHEQRDLSRNEGIVLLMLFGLYLVSRGPALGL